MTELNLPSAFAAIAGSILGLIIGSFLNVVIHRVPRGESIAFPGSHCPGCGSKLRAYENIPVLSFLLLRGRCRSCGKRISWRYPFVELLTAVLFAAILVKSGPTWEALLEMVFAAVLVSLILIDAIHHLLPNVITYPAVVFAMAGATARAGWGEPTGGFEVSIIIPALLPVFTPWKAALLGGLILAAAAPAFWLLDRMDLLLYDKYFDWEETREEGEIDALTLTDADSLGHETAHDPQAVPFASRQPEFSSRAENLNEAAEEVRYRRSIRASIALGLLVALAWALLCILVSPKVPQAFARAYDGLWFALAGALVGSVPIWWLRAIYFYVRGAEGMGLGDVKLMAIIGAFLGWQGAFGVMLLGSILGTAVGALLIWRSKGGLRTALPFGVCLGAAALVVMLTK